MSVPPIYSLESHPARFEQMVNAIARTQKLLVLCGGSATSECGLPALDDPVDVLLGSQKRRTPLRSLLHDCSPATVPADDLDPRLLAALNQAMAARRVAARSAPPSQFHHFLDRMCTVGKLVSLLTTSIDGLEARGDPVLEALTVMLHGDNRVLRSSRRGCSGESQADTSKLDDTLLHPFMFGDSVDHPGPLCEACLKKHKKTAISRRGCSTKTLLLRPAVQLEMAGEMVTGEMKVHMLASAQACQLLLIVEQPLKPQSLLDLTWDLADAVHAQSGAVLYVAREPLRGRNMYNHIDAQLQLNALELVATIMGLIDQPVSIAWDGEVDVYNEPDFWFDIVNNELPTLTRSEDAPYDGEFCECCLCGVAEYLVKCQSCASRFCCRQTGDDESSTAEGDEESMDEPGEKDDFVLEEACIILNVYSNDSSRPTLERAKREFVCPDCWKYDIHGLYPHFVRPVPRLRHENIEQRWPRLAMIVYYVEQFWPAAKHLISLVSGRWANKGWSCAIEPIKLEHLAEKKQVFEKMTWEAGSYNVFVVYLTHGLSDEQGYQLAHKQALQPVQFLEHTLLLASVVLRNARDARGFLLSCGHPLYHSGFVADLSKWLNSEGPFDTLLGAMNTKLSVAYLVNLIARLSTQIVDPDPCVAERMFQMWLTDSIAASHTNILCLSRGSEPMLWLCPGLAGDELKTLRRLNSRKAWEVDHNGVDGVALRDVVVKATCTVCRQVWPLLLEHLAGTLRKHSGTFAALMPYFATSNNDKCSLRL